jgi:hypothetical protein
MLKMNTRHYVVCLIAGMLIASSALAVPTNGDFNSGLDGWTIEPIGSVTDGGGYALFAENFDYLPMSLSQAFTLPADSLELSFDRTLVTIGGGSLPATDSFTVSLLDVGWLRRTKTIQ